MIIARAKEGETIADIVAEYGVSAEYVSGIMGCGRRELCPGREISIHIPSRSINARRGDTVESIAHRFERSVGEILALNPEIRHAGRVYPSEYVVIGMAEPKIGVAAVNGRVYRGVSAARLAAALPYLSTLTVMAARAVGGRIRIDEGMIRLSDMARVAGVCPFLGIFIERIDTGENDSLCRGAIMAAQSHGMAGISISGIKGSGDEVCELVLKLRRMAMECGILVSVEGDLCRESRYSEYADFAVMTLDRDISDADVSFDEFEGARILSAVGGREVSNMLLDLPAFGISGDGFIGREELFASTGTRGTVIEHNEKAMTVGIKRGGRVTVTESLANVMERIRLAVEGGFLGFSVDLLRVPFYELFSLYTLTSRPMNLPVGENRINCQGKI